MMDEEFLQAYVNKLAGKVNELQQENILLKAQLEFANAKVKSYEQAQQELEEPVEEEKPRRDSQFRKSPPKQNFSTGEISGND